jgi:class 3 adenylate cyclase
MGAATRRPVILCVDDEPIVLESLREQFRRQFDGRFEVETANDSEEGLELLGELREAGVDVPVVLSDHIMPGMKGDAFLVAVHGSLPRTRKILLTGQAGVDALGHVVNQGALYRYVAKPWARDDLMLTIQEAVRGYYNELEVERQRERLGRAHAAGLRFVPFEVLRLLGRERLEEVSLDDHVEQPMSAMSCDIRAFTALAEGKTPKQVFHFINEYLGCIEPAILAEGGFIDSFAGDGIMALFGGGPDHAVRAGIATLRAVDRLNDALVARGEAPIRVGIGVHTGALMLGILGATERLKVGVLGDPVDVSAWLEAYSKEVGATRLVSERTVEHLDDRTAYTLRRIEDARLVARSGGAPVYEVLDALSEAERARKLATRGDPSP